MKTYILTISLFLMIGVSNSQNKPPQENRKKAMNDEKKELVNLATRSFSWITGLGADNDYVSVGKVAHYFGVISLRLDSDHSLTRGGVGKKVFSVLNTSQQEDLSSILEKLEAPLKKYHKYHELVNRSLEKMLHNQVFDEELCLLYAQKIVVSEGEIGYITAQHFKEIYNTLSENQKKELKAIKKQILLKKAVDSKINVKKSAHENIKELWNLSTRFLAWITATDEEVAFSTTGKKSQHFGFVKVRVSSGHAITRGGIAKEVLSLYNDSQKAMLQDYVKKQHEDLLAFNKLRGLYTKELRSMLKKSVDATKLEQLSLQMGTVEGKMTIGQAKLYVSLRNTFSNDQMKALSEMRSNYLPNQFATHEEQDLLSLGAKVYSMCAMCHSTDEGKNLTGPSLYHIVNRKTASVDGFEYSPALLNLNRKWSEENLDLFIENPKKFAPGTKMPFSGLVHKKEREALLVYLKSLQ